MHNSVAAMESCVWPDHVYRNRADCQVNITRPPAALPAINQKPTHAW
jgi:hypothetical protein